MSLTSARPTLKAALLVLANNTNENVTKDAAIENFLDALENWVKSAQVNVPGNGLTSPAGAVTGTVIGASLT